MLQIAKPRITPTSAIAAGVLALAAVTAVAVAPRSSAELPETQTVVEPVVLPVAAGASVDRFLQVERVRRGESLASLMARLGAVDADFQRFVGADPTAPEDPRTRAGPDGARRTRRRGTDPYAASPTVWTRSGIPMRAWCAPRTPGDDPAQGRPFRSPARNRLPIERETVVRQPADREHARGGRGSGRRAGLASSPSSTTCWDTTSIFSAACAGATACVWPGNPVRRGPGHLDAPAAGRMLAAELVVGGVRREAYWFERGSRGRTGRGEYFGADGRSLQHSFLRSPLESTRVMSGFSRSRLHPVVGGWRAHKGVDLSAPLGTAGSGRR
jgi:hypothetical protein